MVLALPSLILVFAARDVIGGIRLDPTTWLASLGLMWLALIPPAILGLGIGLWVKAEAGGGVTTLVLLLAMLGGLWMAVLLGWAVGLTVLGAVGLRRAAARSKR